MMKKIIRIVLIVLLVLIGVAFAAPFIFKSKIIAIAKEQINRNINVHVEFADVNISFFRHFPRVALGMEKLSVVGVDEFSRDTLIYANQLDVAVNLMSLLRGSNMNVYSITLDQPMINAIVNSDGKANWDITKPDTASSAAPAAQEKPFNLTLQHYAINDGFVSYRDAQAGINTRIEHLTHSGSGDFTASKFTLSTKTLAQSASFNYGGIPYLAQAKTSIDANIEIDNSTSTYRFKTGDILVNNLKLAADGYFRFVNDSTYDMDIRFNTPSNQFKDILSLIPSIYQNNFEKIKSSGTAAFKGFVKGQVIHRRRSLLIT